MSNYISEEECPACGTPRMYAYDCRETYGAMNPYVFECSHCAARYRYTDHGELELVEVEE